MRVSKQGLIHFFFCVVAVSSDSDSGSDSGSESGGAKAPVPMSSAKVCTVFIGVLMYKLNLMVFLLPLHIYMH